MIVYGTIKDYDGRSKNIMLVTAVTGDRLSGIPLYLDNCPELTVGEVSTNFLKEYWSIFTGTLTLQNELTRISQSIR